jgi:DNA-directed RNA polymerase subunit RPC12/RpoP
MSDGLPDQIVCVDCGGTAHRLTPAFEDGDAEGDVVAYRCADCWDRWDLVVGDPDGA